MKDHPTPSHSVSSAAPSTLQRKILVKFFSSNSASGCTLISIGKIVWIFLFLGFYLTDLKDIASLIETGSYSKEVRRIARAVRLTIALRRKLTASVLLSFIDYVASPGSEAHSRLSAYLPKVKLGHLLLILLRSFPLLSKTTRFSYIVFFFFFLCTCKINNC